ncbi:activator-dependent family glycosyltransferase [Streptomyces sp. MN03-5084-2B]|nr:activator-dependent family glycosyltransferase [Streptomyces sp. MN03-5084-2B]
MRVLLAVNPGTDTIFQYMVPLMWALRTAGHEVHVSGPQAKTEAITQAGLTAVPAGRPFDPSRVNNYKIEIVKSMEEGILPPYDAFDDPEKATWEYLRPGMETAVKGMHRMISVPIISDVVEYARYWKPDLVLWDPLTFAGSIAAKACGAAHARLLFGIDIFGGVRQLFLRLKAEQPEEDRSDPLAHWLGSYARKYGGEFSEDMVTGHFTIDQFPTSLQTEAEGLHYTRMQYIPYGGAAVLPDWLREPPKRPRIAFTLGMTSATQLGGYRVDVQEILDNLADLDIEIVATIAESEQHRITRIPDNTRIVSFVPWHALVPTCTAVIHHAGAATLGTAARYPQPHLALHDHFDQPILAEKLADYGAGIAIHNSEATGASVRQAVQKLLTQPRFRRRAADLTNDILAMPTPNQLVPELEELTTKYRNR